MTYFFEPIKQKYRIYYDGTHNYVLEKFKKGKRDRGVGVGKKFSGWYNIGYFPSITWMVDHLHVCIQILKNKPFVKDNPESGVLYEDYKSVLESFTQYDVMAEAKLMRNDPNKMEMTEEHKAKVVLAAKKRKKKS